MSDVQVNGAEVSLPRIEVANRSDQPVRYFELGWIVKDPAGRDYLAGSNLPKIGEHPISRE